MKQIFRIILILLLIPTSTTATALPDSTITLPTPESQPLLRPFLSTQPTGLYSTASYSLSTLNRINYHRALAGMSPVAMHSLINAAAQAHADYLNLHNYSGHDESNGLAGFTGQWAWDRMNFQGYSYSTAGEVISFGEDAQAGVDALITAIYHRFALLDPGYTETGIGDAAHPYYTMCQVINLGRPTGVAAATDAVAIYPADGQSEVPTTFNSDEESPDPAPGLGLVGYPVSIQFSGEYSVTLGSFTISESGGPALTALLLQPGSNSSMPASKRNYALIPTSPLQPDTTYEVSFSATVNGNPFTTSWSFSTVPPAVLTVTPNPATFALGQPGVLTINGGSGGYGVSWNPGTKIDLSFDGDTMLITPKATGTTTITLTDNATSAVVQIPVTIISSQPTLSGSQALIAGWNLLALPLTPASTTATTVIGGIINQVISAWKWTGATWSVYLGPATANDGGAQYASDKGFTLLQTLNAGEGFWLNASSPTTFNYTGLSPASSVLTLNQGWNLVGLKTTQEHPVGDIAYPSSTTIISLWTWTGSKWAVTLPQASDGGADYAASKGFALLQTVSPGQGFWVNVQ